MADVQAAWTRDTDANVASYTIFFQRTAAGSSTPDPMLSVSVPRTSAGDTGGYTTSYNTITPTPTALAAGDSVAVSGEDVDTFGQASPIVVATGSPVVITIVPPPPPTGPVGLTATQV